MRRFYYTGDSLDELECVQRDLEGVRHSSISNLSA